MAMIKWKKREQRITIRGRNRGQKEKEDSSPQSVTQRATEGLTETSSLWCDASGISGWAVMRCKWRRPGQQSSRGAVTAGRNLWFVTEDDHTVQMYLFEARSVPFWVNKSWRTSLWNGDEQTATQIEVISGFISSPRSQVSLHSTQT